MKRTLFTNQGVLLVTNAFAEFSHTYWSFELHLIGGSSLGERSLVGVVFKIELYLRNIKNVQIRATKIFPS